MNIGQRVRALQDSQLGRLVLIPVRLPGAVIHFVLDMWTKYQQDQAWRKHGRTINVADVLRDGEPWLPNGQQH